MEEILFICTGNTCRSPMAEGIFYALHGVERTGLKPASAGLFAHTGMSASMYAIEACKQYGADLSEHHARQVDTNMVQHAKYIVCMTAAHYDQLIQMFPQAETRTFLLGQTDVQDPFGGDLLVYQASAAQIKDMVQQLIENLERKS